MAGILIYSDKDNLAFELATAAGIIAKDTGSSVYALSINDDQQADAIAAKGIETLQVINDNINFADVECIASILKNAAGQVNADTILLSGNRRGKELAGRIGQKLAAGVLTDVNKIRISDSKIECERNALAGATIATQTIETEYKIFSVSPKSFAPAENAEGGSVKEIDVEVADSNVNLIEIKEKTADSVDIEAADILIAVGCGVKSADDLAIIDNLATALGAAVGCSKPVATDKKWFSEERIIGLSGKKCKPDLAILVGVSAQVQFAVGIRDSKTIVSINTDENANSISMSDYFIADDLYEVIPALSKILG